MRNKFVREALASLKSSVIALLCRPDLTSGTAVTDLGNLNAMEIIGCQGGRAQMEATTKGKMDIVTIMDSRIKAAIIIL